MPLVWGVIRRTQGLPMFGAPTVAELESAPLARVHERSADGVIEGRSQVR